MKNSRELITVVLTLILLSTSLMIAFDTAPSAIFDNDGRVRIKPEVERLTSSNSRNSLYHNHSFGGSWVNDMFNMSGLSERDNISFDEGAAITDSWKFKKTIEIDTPVESVPLQIPVEFNATEFNYSRARDNGDDIRFSSPGGDELPHWIEKWNSNGETRVWVKVPALMEGVNQIEMHYGNLYAGPTSNGSKVFEFFEDFNSLNQTLWTPTHTWALDLGYLYIYRGSVHTNTNITTQPNRTCEARIRYDNFRGFTGLCISDDDRTAGNNNGWDALVYLMNYQNTNSITSWAATGNTRSYDIVANGAEFIADTSAFYVMGFSMNNTSVSYYVDREMTNTYPGTWSAPSYLWLGYYSGAAAGGSDGADMAVDWVIVRNNTPKNMTVDMLDEVSLSDPYLITETVTLPDNCTWNSFSINANFPAEAGTMVTVLNASDNVTIPGFKNIPKIDIDISNISQEELRFRVQLTGVGMERPRILSIGADWTKENSWYDSFVGLGNTYSSSSIQAEGGGIRPEGWKYQRNVNIIGSGAEMIDYQIKLIIDNDDFDYTHADPLGDDLRFLDRNNNSLSYWIEEWDPAGDSVVWVKVKDIPPGESSISMLYGNPEAEAESSGEKTFEFFEDFNSNELDITRWFLADATGLSFADGQLLFTSNNGRIISRQRFSGPIIQEVKFKVLNKGNNGIQPAGFYVSNQNCFGYLTHINQEYIRNNGAWRGLGGVFVQLDAWYNIAVIAKDSSAVNLLVENYDTGAEYYNQNFDNEVIGESVMLGRRSDDWTPNQDVEAYWDHVKCRKYTPALPHVSLGAEKHREQPFVISELIELPQGMLWRDFGVGTVIPQGTSIHFSVLDGATGKSIPDFEDFQVHFVDLDPLNDLYIESIFLRANLTGTASDRPRLTHWGLNWTMPEAPDILQDINDISVDEESSQVPLVNLSEVYEDLYSHRQDTYVFIADQSDTENISISFNGSYLWLNSTRNNWSGITNATVGFTNMYNWTSFTNTFNITVENVNDIPYVRLSEPGNNALIPTTAVNLKWEVEDSDTSPEKISYDLYFGEKPFPPEYRSDIKGNNFTLESLHHGSIYYWYVVPHDGKDKGAYVGDTWKFFVEEEALDPEIVLRSPGFGDWVNDTEVQLVWELLNGTGAFSNFSIYLGNSKNNLSLFDTAEILSYNLDGLIPNQTYYWRILASLEGHPVDIASPMGYFSTGYIEKDIHEIVAELNRDEVSLSEDEKAYVELTLRNMGNGLELVTLEPLGSLAPFIEMNRSHSLNPGDIKVINITILLDDNVDPGDHELLIRIKYHNEVETKTIKIELTGKKKNDEGVLGLGSIQPLWLIIGAAGLLFVLILIIIIARKKSKRKEEARASEKERSSSISSAESSKPITAQELYGKDLYAKDIYAVAPASNTGLDPYRYDMPDETDFSVPPPTIVDGSAEPAPVSLEEGEIELLPPEDPDTEKAGDKAEEQSGMDGKAVKEAPAIEIAMDESTLFYLPPAPAGSSKDKEDDKKTTIMDAELVDKTVKESPDTANQKIPEISDNNYNDVKESKAADNKPVPPAPK